MSTETKETMIRTTTLESMQKGYLSYCYNHNCTACVDFFCCCTQHPKIKQNE